MNYFVLRKIEHAECDTLLITSPPHEGLAIPKTTNITYFQAPLPKPCTFFLRLFRISEFTPQAYLNSPRSPPSTPDSTQNPPSPPPAPHTTPPNQHPSA